MIAKNKRVIYLSDGTKLSLSSMELYEWIDPKSYGSEYIESRASELLVRDIMKETWTLNGVNKIGFDHFMAWYEWGVVNKYVPYAGDTQTFHRDDWWALPSEVVDWVLKLLYEGGKPKIAGFDCEDTTFALASALDRLRIYRSNDSKNYYFACLGYYNDNKQLYGHAFPIWRDRYLSQAFKKTYWAVLESTLDNFVNPQFALPWNPDQYIIAIAFNRDTVLRMDNPDDRKVLGLTDDWYNKYKDDIAEMINYITTGKKLEVSWMHKTKRPVPIDKLEKHIIAI